MAYDERPSTDDDWLTELRPHRAPAAYPPDPWLDGGGPTLLGDAPGSDKDPAGARHEPPDSASSGPGTTATAAGPAGSDSPTIVTPIAPSTSPRIPVPPAQPPAGPPQPPAAVPPSPTVASQPPAAVPQAPSRQPQHGSEPARPSYQQVSTGPVFDARATYRPAPAPPPQSPAPPQSPSPAQPQDRQASPPPYGRPGQHYVQPPAVQQPAAQPPESARVRPTSSDLTPASLVKPDAEIPHGGWRRAIFKMSGGSINPGRSKEQVEREDLIGRIRTPIRGCRRIAVVSLKGGIGKTTTTSCLGLTLAHYRGDRVVALDANPDAGTLAERLTGVTDVSVRDLLDHIEQVDTFTDISRYMSLAQRLQVLASDQDPEISEAFDAEQYRKVTGLLSRYYNVILTDSGTGMLHSAMQGTLEAADSLVVVGAPSVDGSSRASKTLDWLIAHGREDLVSNSVAVISSVREKANDVDMSILRNHFGTRCRAVVEIPFDPHLVIGGPIDLRKIKEPTARAYLELAATVADGFRA